nr:hypothetical protein BgiMline_028765 [Biomphalaria glabrata]
MIFDHVVVIDKQEFMEKTKWLRVYINCRKCGSIFIYRYRIICEHCKEAYYCSTTCRREDYNVHKKYCEAIYPDASRISTGSAFGEDLKSLNELFLHRDAIKANCPKMFEKEKSNCLVCHKMCDKSISCAICRGGYYCSISCQSKYKAQHKPSCALIALYTFVDQVLIDGQTFQLLQTKGLTENTKTSALLGNLVHELAPTIAATLYIQLKRPVIIAQIVSPYPHMWRSAVVVSDVHQMKLHIIFHDEQRTEAAITGYPDADRLAVTMEPLLSCLRPGNFIILLDAWLHTFKDLTTGVRIDDLRKVHFVWAE